MDNNKIEYCDACLQDLDNFNKGVSNQRFEYLGKKNDCYIHNPIVKIYKINGTLKWTDGKPYEKSRIMKDQIQMEQEKITADMEMSAYTSSLHHDENTWDILNKSLSCSGFKVSNKREELGNKLADREMVQQIGFNPFLSETNYVDDILVRDQFLKPINTTQDNTESPFTT